MPSRAEEEVCVSRYADRLVFTTQLDPDGLRRWDSCSSPDIHFESGSFDASKTRARYWLTKRDATFPQLGFSLPSDPKADAAPQWNSALRRLGDGSVPRFTCILDLPDRGSRSSVASAEVAFTPPPRRRAKIHHSGTILRFSWDCHPTHHPPPTARSVLTRFTQGVGAEPHLFRIQANNLPYSSLGREQP